MRERETQLTTHNRNGEGGRWLTSRLGDGFSNGFTHNASLLKLGGFGGSS